MTSGAAWLHVLLGRFLVDLSRTEAVAGQPLSGRPFPVLPLCLRRWRLLLPGAQARAKGWNVLLGPTVDIERNPRAGHAAEAFQYLGSRCRILWLAHRQVALGTPVEDHAHPADEFESRTGVVPGVTEGTR